MMEENTERYSLYAAKRGLDVDDGGSVDDFDGTDSQAVLVNLAYGEGMKTERIWPVRRALRKNAR